MAGSVTIISSLLKSLGLSVKNDTCRSEGQKREIQAGGR